MFYFLQNFTFNIIINSALITDTPFCKVGIHTKNKALTRIILPNQLINLSQINCSSELSNFHKSARKQLKEFFYLKRETFTISYKISLSPFCKRVLKEINKIPYGKTLSYAQIAKNINESKAYRAVGMACKNNHIPVVITCHRVILKSGEIGDYAGGLSLKAKILNKEII